MTAADRELVAPSRMRAAIGRRMVASKREAPHFYVSTEIEMGAVLASVDARTAGEGPRVTVTAYIVHAVAGALAEHPELNAVWNAESLYRVTTLNIGVAIALDDGLIAPALLDCRDRDVADLAAGLADLAARARAGRLRAPELADATFTVSNLGMFDVSAFTAIITPPQVAILATGRTEQRPVVRDGEIVARHLMTGTVSADHRAVDGAAVARFVGTVKRRLEAPIPQPR